MSNKTTIPYYYLFSEIEPIDELEFLHLEPLGKRSRPFNWQIEPHRHDHLFQILFLAGGSLSVAFEAEWEQWKGPAIFTVPPKHVHGFSTNEDVTGCMITIAEPFLLSLFSEADRKAFHAFFQSTQKVVLNMESSDSRDIKELIERIKREYYQQKMGRVQLIGSYLRAILALLTRCHHSSQVLTAERANEQETFDRFSQMVEAHYREHWTLEKYCEMLGVTSRRLGRICELTLNKTPYEYIQKKLLVEAKCSLVYTLATVSEIAYDLGFKDPAYFSRFFSKQAGMSPSEFILKFRK